MHGAVGAARERGVEGIGDAELVAIVGGIGARAASEVLEAAGGIGGIARVGASAGVGPSRALRIEAAIELGRRALGASVARQAMSDDGAVARWAEGRLLGLEHEELWALGLDGRNRLLAARRCAAGGIHGLHVAVRDVLRPIVRDGASSFVLVHNHPSGDPRPSAEDIAFTKRVAAGAELVGVPLLDHVVCARDRHVSMLREGILP